MTKGRPAKRAKGRSDAAGRRAASTRSPAPASKGSKPKKPPKPAPSSVPPREEPRTFRLGTIPGATPGKWIDAWQERMPHVPLELVPVAVAHQRDTLAVLDASLVRLPTDREGLSVIPLYDEVAVVVISVDSALTVADELGPEDLVGEVVIVPRDDVLGDLGIPGTVAPTFEPPADTAEAIETVAAGVGVVVVPMSLARLHHRKDVTFRPLRGAPASAVALAWESERTTADVETFVGIVRGRTAHSSRG